MLPTDSRLLGVREHRNRANPHHPRVFEAARWGRRAGSCLVLPRSRDVAQLREGTPLAAVGASGALSAGGSGWSTARNTALRGVSHRSKPVRPRVVVISACPDVFRLGLTWVRAAHTDSSERRPGRRPPRISTASERAPRQRLLGATETRAHRRNRRAAAGAD